MNSPARHKPKAPARRGRIIILSGPSGSGKTTLHKGLLKRAGAGRRLVRSVSATTRPQRPGEKNGRDYFFLSPAEFNRRRGQGYFLESKRVFGQWYGTPRASVERLLASGTHVVLCIDVQGARSVRRRYPDALGIFITVPSFAELKRRLRARGTETNRSTTRRLAIARKELREARYYQHIVVNDDLTTALKQLQSIICSEAS